MGGSLAGALKGSATSGGLGLTDAQLGVSSSCYLLGAVIGALVFGYLADRYGRRKLFFWTLVLYLSATATTGLSWSLLSFTVFRMITGAGIGGEYAAINSAVDELIPARLRGRVDLWINGTFWLGILLGSIVSANLLTAKYFGSLPGWRVAFLSGLPIGMAVLVMRRYIPESPRWLLSRGEISLAETVVRAIENEIETERGVLLPAAGPRRIEVAKASRLRRMAIVLTGAYRRRAILCFILMAAQAFFYNSVFFSLSLVLMRYYSVSSRQVGYDFIPIAIANFLGPVLLGRFFDTIGRKQMICAMYCLSGVALLVSASLFHHKQLSTNSQILGWVISFFFASTAASSAYLTVSEVFPQEIRATAIAFFYAFGTLAGGVTGPLIFGHLIGDGSRTPLFFGYVLGAAVMVAAGIAQALWGVAAEGKSLEAVAASN